MCGAKNIKNDSANLLFPSSGRKNPIFLPEEHNGIVHKDRQPLAKCTAPHPRRL